MIYRHPLAYIDIRMKAASLAGVNRKWAEKFLRMVEKTLDKVDAITLMRSPLEMETPEGKPIYFVPVRKFPNHLLLFTYSDDPERIELIRVLHGAEDIFEILAEE